MPVFDYRALQSDGSITEGHLEAGGRPEALRQIEARRLRTIRLVERGNGKPQPARSRGRSNGASASPSATPTPTPPSKGSSAPGAASSATGGAPSSSSSSAAGSAMPWGKSAKITARMLENFTRLLSSLMAAGVPLSRALVILHKESSNPAAGAKWKEIHDLVVDGMSLADAMAKFPDTFPRVYVAMVEAGETGGFLDIVLSQIADFQARDKELKGKVLAALLYPVILLVLAIGVLVLLLVFFIPQFQTIFTGFGGQLPLLTQMIVATSDVLRHYGFFLAIGLVIVGALIRNWFTSTTGRRAWEGAILRLPMVGPLVAQFAMARFCRMLGTLLGAGVPLINSLNVARRSIGNQILVDAVANSTERVKEGKALGPSLSECRTLFPGSVLEMIAVAEESARLDKELVRIADVTEGDLDRQLRTVVALAEPLMLFAIAGFIGTIFIGMVIPIFTLQDYIK